MNITYQRNAVQVLGMHDGTDSGRTGSFWPLPPLLPPHDGGDGGGGVEVS